MGTFVLLRSWFNLDVLFCVAARDGLVFCECLLDVRDFRGNCSGFVSNYVDRSKCEMKNSNKLSG